MDELSLLVADSMEVAAIERILAAPALKPLQAPDFTGSLSYIDSLASRTALAVSRRDVATIATAGLMSRSTPAVRDSQAVSASDFDTDSLYVSSSRPLADGRMFDPQGDYRRPAARVRSASDVVARFGPTGPRPRFPSVEPTRDRPIVPWIPDEYQKGVARELGYIAGGRQFRKASLVDICLRRRIRRSIAHAMGFAGSHYIGKPTRNYFSNVICSEVTRGIF